ncbi:MAG: sugar kinase [Gemmatimonadetes bacterium]|nr:sugar kinase [Gemmatimonadota bacterium]
MSILVVGSVALDTIETPFGRVEEVVGGSAVHFSAAASLFAPVHLVGVVGQDYPVSRLDMLRERGVDLSGLEVKPGESFRWSGRYGHDLSTAHTLETRLGVFADFHPRIPASFRKPRILFLGNIDPVLQLEVLDAVEKPELAACDTMNFWIAGRRDDLLRLLRRVDLLFVNDAEIRQLAGEPNLVRAARWVQERGPTRVVVKKGEHGAVLFDHDEIFFVPGYPLEKLNDPTGAGDAFAGGVLGCLHHVGDISAGALRSAAVFGSAVGSFSVEDFGAARLEILTRDEVAGRVRELCGMTHFEIVPSSKGVA